MSSTNPISKVRKLGAAAVVAVSALAMAPAAIAEEKPYGPDPKEDIRGGVLTVGSLVEPPALDPFHQGAGARIQVTTLIYQGLFYEGESGPVPLLVTSHKISDDGLTYTFTLRKGVKFHTGQDMTAADVKYSYDYIRNPDNGSPGAGDFSTVKSIEVTDDHTVVFKLSEPNASLLVTLGNKYGAVVPAGTFDKEGSRAALNQKSVGTGPFKIATYETNSFLELVAFKDYWQKGVPYLDGVTFLFMPNNAALLVALRNKRIDFAKLGRPQDSEQLADVKYLEIKRWQSLGQKPLDLDSNYGPLKDVRVRQAIALTVDKEQILQAALGGYGTVIHTIVAGMQDSWGVPVKELEFQTRDVKRAKALMAEAGHADGVEMDLTTIAGYDWMDPAAVTLREQLSEIGITLNIKRVDLGVWIDNFRKKNMGLTFNDWATQPDPNMLYFRHFHMAPEGADFRNWKNKEASALLRKGRATSDPAERKKIYAEFQKILDRTVPTIMLFSADIVTVANERVKNLYQHPTGWYFGLAKTQVAQ